VGVAGNLRQVNTPYDGHTEQVNTRHDGHTEYELLGKCQPSVS
jgi:hypothetical protein